VIQSLEVGYREAGVALVGVAASVSEPSRLGSRVIAAAQAESLGINMENIRLNAPAPGSARG